MLKSCIFRVLCGVGFVLAWTVMPAHAVAIYDLNAEDEPILPTVIEGITSPVYITNTSGSETEEEGGSAPASGEGASATVESMRIGQRAQLHLGYGPNAVATDAVGVNVTNSMLVEGLVRLGKESTYYTPGMPNAATSQAIQLRVGETLAVTNGGMIIATGASDGETNESGEDGDSAEKHYSDIQAKSVMLDGGSLVLEKYSTLTTGVTQTDDDSPTVEALSNGVWYGVNIRNGGMLKLNGGRPDKVTAGTDSGDGDGDDENGDGEDDGAGDGEETRAAGMRFNTAAARHSRAFLNNDDSEWVFNGMDVSAGGRGVLVDNGGVLAAGRAGGVVLGAAGQVLEVRAGGTLDASEGDLVVSGIDSVAVAGTYKAGYDNAAGKTTQLVAPDAVVAFSDGSDISLSRDLQRHLNANGTAMTDSTLLQAASVQFANGAPVLDSGMGTYGLELGRDSDSGSDYLRVGWVANQVLGSSTSADKEQFRSNMSRVWRDDMKQDQAGNIYNLTAVSMPLISADGEAGHLNQAVLEALVDGSGSAVSGMGVADRGIYEMYNLSSQWGVNNAQFGTAEEFMGQLDRRVDRIGAEMDRLGLASTESVYGVSGIDGIGYASLALLSEYPSGRVWAGGFGRNEKVEFDSGAGYKYRPRGVAVGYDRDVGRLNVGVAGAYGRGDYEDTIAIGNDSKIENYSAGLYGSYHGCNGAFVSAQATYSHFDNDISDIRGGMNRQADHTGYAWTLGAKLGFDKLLTNRIMITPTVGVNRAHSVSRAHDEYLNGVNVLTVGKTHRDSVTVPVELGLGVDLVRRPEAVLRLTGTAGYAYDFGDGSLDGMFTYNGLTGSVAMEAAERKPGRNRVNVGGGLVFTGRRVDFSTRYDYFHRSRQKTHQAQGSLGVKF